MNGGSTILSIAVLLLLLRLKTRDLGKEYGDSWALKSALFSPFIIIVATIVIPILLAVVLRCLVLVFHHVNTMIMSSSVFISLASVTALLAAVTPVLSGRFDLWRRKSHATLAQLFRRVESGTDFISH
jgi:hypothetical protein